MFMTEHENYPMMHHNIITTAMLVNGDDDTIWYVIWNYDWMVTLLGILFHVTNESSDYDERTMTGFVDA